MLKTVLCGQAHVRAVAAARDAAVLAALADGPLTVQQIADRLPAEVVADYRCADPVSVARASVRYLVTLHRVRSNGEGRSRTTYAVNAAQDDPVLLRERIRLLERENATLRARIDAARHYLAEVRP